MANYVYNRVLCTQEFLTKYFIDENPFDDSKAPILEAKNRAVALEPACYYISFNKLLNCKTTDEYQDKYGTIIDYDSGFGYRLIDNDMCEVLFDTRWYYPINAIIKACEFGKENLTWFAMEENAIYFSKFKWSNNQVEEDTLFNENDDEYLRWEESFLESIQDYVAPNFWVWGYTPEEKDGWVNWPCDDLVKRYLNDYPSREYYNEMSGRK